MKDQRNLILAFALSFLVLFGSQLLFGPPKKHPVAPQTQTSPQAPSSAAPTPTAGQPDHGQVLAEAPRIAIETPRLKGSLSLAGARIDDLTLVDYYETVERKKQVTLLAPAGSADPYYLEFGWTAAGNAAALPGPQTVWTGAADQKLTPQTPVTLTWDNGGGLTFTRTISIDGNYLFTIKQSVANHGAAAVTLRPYGTVVRLHPPSEKQSSGPAPSVAGYYGNGLEEVTYSDLFKKGPVENAVTGGWVAMNDKYWLVAAVPQHDMPAALSLRDTKTDGGDRYSAGFQGGDMSVAPGASVETTTMVVAGAKEQGLLADYEAANQITKLERTIDFGWLFFLAKPFFLAIHIIAQYVGNFGVAILIFNVLLKIVLFPLQDRSFHQMARMRDLQPKIAALKERFGDDREKMAQAQMELFKAEKINPASGCLPIFVQLPIFYALFRVLSTTIEMRHAPFFGWIHDLSAKDPTTIFNLFGLIPWAPPEWLPALGVWPLIYGGTMYLQQRMTPTPTTDPTQARVMAMMPLVFMFFFASFPAGLTIYYSWNAVLTIGQMELIRRRSDRRKAVAPAANKA